MAANGDVIKFGTTASVVTLHQYHPVAIADGVLELIIAADIICTLGVGAAVCVSPTRSNGKGGRSQYEETVTNTGARTNEAVDTADTHLHPLHRICIMHGRT
ncbi:hypothetical protein E2562_022977 [Oryza meyeriana var. granulata]|uniref:Uncharacterized protein n=1 Tax=Oryza meyeriana var. granulata TaxID=110450 RepID=A0A6G1EYF0_9ORYZ|nr:hypothetical protein E2562_022977 [Oryza meyeriana var. granulata]